MNKMGGVIGWIQKILGAFGFFAGDFISDSILMPNS
tara:strand:- start:145 stop:252 length:108 start_codon:yes stop_codon:yes gene_type:complete